jgi:hypothetical protein
MSRGFTYAFTSTAKPFHALSGTPLLRPAHRVMGYSAQQKAKWALAVAVCDVAGLEKHYAACCAELGKANKGRKPQCRAWQVTAFRQINKARASLRVARRDLVVAQDAVLALVGV